MRKFVVYLSAAGLGLLLLGAGCRSGQTISPSAVQQAAQQTVDTQWKMLAPGIYHRAIPTGEKTAPISLYRFAANEFVLEFQQATGTGDVADWHRAHPEALLVSNGGYFNEDSMPSGFLKINGEMISARRFDLDKSALVVGGEHPRFVDTAVQAFPEQEENILQSYPILLKEGKQAVQTDSGKRARRSFIGFDKQGQLYIGVLSEGDMTLFELARTLFHAEIDWQDVLNIDGGPSTGISAKIGDWQELKNSWTSVPNVLLIQRKK